MPLALVVGTLQTACDRAPVHDGPAENVILIVVDTTRRDGFGCYGSQRPTTPHMDQLASEGVRFDDAIAQSCWTLPTITSILTSTHPTIHGALGKTEIGAKNVVFQKSRKQVPHGPEILSSNGMATFAVVNAGFLHPELGMDRGFDKYDFFPGHNLDIRRADKSVDAAIAFMEEHSDESVFLFLHLFDPHLNYDPPRGYKDRYSRGYTGPFLTLTPMQYVDLLVRQTAPPKPEQEYLRAQYDAEITFMDDQVGRLIAVLKADGAYDRTTIIIVADHGEEFWDHGGFEHGHSMHHELIRVPMIIKLPKRLPLARKTVETRVRQIDIMPTVFDVLGLEHPNTFKGQSLLKLITDAPEPEQRTAYSEGTLYGIDKTAYYDGDYKLILDESDGSLELYDVRRDPLETNNLVEDLPEIAASLRTKLKSLDDALLAEAAQLPPPEKLDLTEKANEDVLRQIESLGYARDPDKTHDKKKTQ